MKKLINAFLFSILFFNLNFLQAQCLTGSDEPPGCDFRCEQYFGKLAFLNPDVTAVNSACPNDFNTRWISVTAKDDFIKITLDSFVCSPGMNFSVQVFDKNLQSITDCKTFEINAAGEFELVSNLTPGEKYSIAFQSAFGKFCPFEISLEGIETDALTDIGDIRLTQNGLQSTLEIDPIPGARNYIWSGTQNGQITSGQGTTQVEIDWRATNMESVCLTVEFDCTVKEKCKGFFVGFANGVCLPARNGTPAGNELSTSCFACGPIHIGSSAGYTATAPGSAAFPCGDIENNQFIAFWANSGTEQIVTILPSDCQDSAGLELIVYDQNFNPVSDCFTPDTSFIGSVTATRLVPGDVYYIMIDGVRGDVCDFLITIGNNYVCDIPDGPGPMTVVPNTSPLCPGSVVTYSNRRRDFTSAFEWTIPANAHVIDGGGTQDTFVTVEYFAPGGGVVRFTPKNFCFPGIPAIEPIVVLPILPTLIPPEFICSEELPIVRDGNVFNSFGSHEVIYKNGMNCDSVVTYIFVPKPQAGQVIDTTVCPGESVYYGGDLYGETGIYHIPLGGGLTQANGCDSVMTINLKVSPAAEVLTPDSLDVPSVNPIKLDGSLSTNEPGIIYNWVATNGGVLVGNDDESIAFAKTPGTYILTARQTNAPHPFCYAKDTVEVVQRMSLPPVFANYASGDSSSVFKVSTVHVLCPGDSKRLTIRPARGADFNWSPSDGLSCTDCAQPIASPTESTIYRVTATLSDGRSGTAEIFVTVLPPVFCGSIIKVDGLRKNIPSDFIEKGNISEANLLKIELELNEKLIKKSIRIFPNPTTGKVQILSESKIINVGVFDFSGRKIVEKTGTEIDLSDFAKGVYILKIQTEEGVAFRRVILAD